MADIASLIIRVITDGTREAESELNSLTSVALKAGAALGGLAAAGEAFNKLIESQRNFDKLNAGLITMTGSVQNAAEAFTALQQFAAKTPYDLDQAVTGFTKLVSLGLDPSEEAMMSFGNTASAMGKDLNQMIEAVADAATGEFERLKEFGIKAKAQGDKIQFTFRGTTTTVKNSADAIQGYLVNIGNTDFAGAMQQRMDTLDGAISNLDDSWEALVLSVAKSGFGDAVRDQVTVASNIISDFTAEIASGELASEVEAWVLLFDNSFGFIAEMLNGFVDDFADAGKKVSPFGQDASDDIQGGFAALPAYVAAIIQDVIAQLNTLPAQADALGKAIKGALNPLSFSDWSDAWKQDREDIASGLVEEQKNIYARRDAIVKGYEDQIAASKKQREEYDKQKAARVDLGKYKVEGDGGSANNGPSKAEISAAKAAARKLESQKNQAKEFIASIQAQSGDELKQIDTAEQQKLEKLAKYRDEDAISQQMYEDTKTQIMLNAETDRQEKIDALVEGNAKDFDRAQDFIANIQAQNEGELAEYQRQQDKKLEILDAYHKAGLVTEKQFQDAKDAMAKDSLIKQTTYAAQQFGDIFGSLSSAMKEGSKEAKAFAIAQAVAQTYLSAVSAYQSASAIPIVGWVLGPIAAAAAVAAGLANVAKIRSARESGGNINAGNISMVGERNKAELIMPAGASRVRTMEQVRQMMGEDKKSSGNNGVVIVNNTTGRIDSATTEMDDEGRLRVLISEHVSNEMQNSNSSISKSRRATRNQPGY